MDNRNQTKIRWLGIFKQRNGQIWNRSMNMNNESLNMNWLLLSFTTTYMLLFYLFVHFCLALVTYIDLSICYIIVIPFSSFSFHHTFYTFIFFIDLKFVTYTSDQMANAWRTWYMVKHTILARFGTGFRYPPTRLTFVRQILYRNPRWKPDASSGMPAAQLCRLRAAEWIRRQEGLAYQTMAVCDGASTDAAAAARRFAYRHFA